MALMVKLMSAEDTPDTDSRKAYELFTDVLKVEFNRGEGGEAYMDLLFRDSEDVETFDVPGNVYVMNENGKTISSFGGAPLIFAEGSPT
jgi:hypothetical protein